MRATALGVLLCLPLAQTPAAAAGKPVRLAYVEWSDAVVATTILKQVLEEKGAKPSEIAARRIKANRVTVDGWLK